MIANQGALDRLVIDQNHTVLKSDAVPGQADHPADMCPVVGKKDDEIAAFRDAFAPAKSVVWLERKADAEGQ